MVALSMVRVVETTLPQESYSMAMVLITNHPRVQESVAMHPASRPPIEVFSKWCRGDLVFDPQLELARKVLCPSGMLSGTTPDGCVTGVLPDGKGQTPGFHAMAACLGPP